MNEFDLVQYMSLQFLAMQLKTTIDVFLQILTSSFVKFVILKALSNSNPNRMNITLVQSSLCITNTVPISNSNGIRNAPECILHVVAVKYIQNICISILA